MHLASRSLFFQNGKSMAAYGSVLNASTAQQATIDKDYSDANIYVELLKEIFPYLQIKGKLKLESSNSNDAANQCLGFWRSYQDAQYPLWCSHISGLWVHTSY